MFSSSLLRLTGFKQRELLQLKLAAIVPHDKSHTQPRAGIFGPHDHLTFLLEELLVTLSRWEKVGEFGLGLRRIGLVGFKCGVLKWLLQRGCGKPGELGTLSSVGVLGGRSLETPDSHCLQLRCISKSLIILLLSRASHTARAYDLK